MKSMILTQTKETVMETKRYAVFQYREDARYRLGDAVGSRLYGRETTAQRAADQHNADPHPWAPRGFVVRSMPYIDARGCVVKADRVRLEVPCSCPDPNHKADAACAYHRLVGF